MISGSLKTTNKKEDSSTTTSISTKAMKSIVERLKANRNRPSTRDNYYGIWKNFNKFFIKLDVKPDSWEERLILYIGFLVDSKRKSTTIRSYISAIKAVLKEDGVDMNEDKFLLASLTRACKLINDKVKTRLPIQKGVLNIIIDELETIFSDQWYLKVLYQALFSTAYFGLFRVSELTQGLHPILARDVHIAENKCKLLFVLRTSKTHGLGVKPQIVKITSTTTGGAETKITKFPDSRCPYQLLRRYLDIRNPYTTDLEPFFIFSDGSPLQPKHFRKTLKMCLKKAGLDTKLYNTSGFRSGRSVDLWVSGISVESIKKIGRWKTNAVYTYLATA